MSINLSYDTDTIAKDISIEVSKNTNDSIKEVICPVDFINETIEKAKILLTIHKI